jgi:3-dehydroquinate dehydratase II
MKILVIHGPNINLLGTREPEHYGSVTMSEINERLSGIAVQVGAFIEFFQSNVEGEIVNKIQEASKGGFTKLIINPAAYTHTSVAIRDAISATKIEAIEVHLSNIHKREDFRQKSLTAPACIGQISGLGAKSYELALKFFLN